MAVASLVLGICSIVLCWTPLLGLGSGIIAIVLAAKVYRFIRDDLAVTGSKGMATAGLVMGIIGLVFSVIYNLIWLFALLTISEWPRWMHEFETNFH